MPEQTITYTVESTSECSDEASVTVTVLTETIISIPNAFSPNGDNMNDFFEVFGDSFELEALQVFNRYGLLIYEGTGNNARWDGSYNQIPQEIGVYVYILEIRSLIENKTEVITGNITLVR